MTDGTNGGTKLLSDINPSGDAMPDQKAVMGNKLYFQADNGSNGYELWITDGTAGGTLMLIDLNNTGSSFPRNMTAVGTNLVFWAQQNGTWKLFRSDGTKGGTLSIKGVSPFDPNGKNHFSAFFENNNTLYFSGYSSTYGEELWQTNGTDTGTTLVADMNAGGDSKPGNWLSHRFTLYFSADDGTHGRELWKLDKNGPTLVADINPGVLSSNPSQLMGWGYNLVVSASDSAGQEPWTIEPISGKASRLGNINPTGSSNPKAFALLGSQLFFMADDGAGMGFQLMNWDGQQLTQIKPASAFSVNPLLYSAELIPYHMGLYFEGSYDASKLELWRVRDTLNTTTGPLVRQENTACIYPIPANDAITIVLPSSEVISISNIAGQTIMPPYNFPAGQAIISTVDWPNGLYVMRTQGWSKKIMVQH